MNLISNFQTNWIVNLLWHDACNEHSPLVIKCSIKPVITRLSGSLGSAWSAPASDRETVGFHLQSEHSNGNENISINSGAWPNPLAAVVTFRCDCKWRWSPCTEESVAFSHFHCDPTIAAGSRPQGRTGFKRLIVALGLGRWRELNGR